MGLRGEPSREKTVQLSASLGSKATDCVSSMCKRPLDFRLDLVARKSHGSLGRQVAAELLGEDLGVLGAHLEAKQRSDVAEYSLARPFWDLTQVLVCDREIEPGLAGPG